MADELNRWLLRQEAAAYLRVSLSTFDRMVRDGTVHRFQAVGYRVPRFDRSQLDRLMERDTGTGSNDSE